MSMIKVAIADDHAVFAKGLKACLEPVEDLAVTVEARNGQDLLQQLPLAPVDIVLMDVQECPSWMGSRPPRASGRPIPA